MFNTKVIRFMSAFIIYKYIDIVLHSMRSNAVARNVAVV